MLYNQFTTWKISHSNTKAQVKKYMSRMKKKYNPKYRILSKYHKEANKNRYKRKVKELKGCRKINNRKC